MLFLMYCIAEKLGLGNIQNPETQREIEINLLIKSAYDKHMETENERIYHSLENHIIPLLNDLLDKRRVHTHPINFASSGFTAPCDRKLNWELVFWAILFHDSIYDSHKFNGVNEINSASFWKEKAKNYLSFGFANVEMVSQMILATYKHESHEMLTREFLKMDLNGFAKPFNEILEDELKVRAEYGWVDWAVYKDERIKFLKAYAENSIIKEMGVADVLLKQAEYMKFVQPKIAVFPGTFKHWHLGHQDVYEKLTKIFDKVIVVFAVNPDKANNITNTNIPKILKNTQVEFVEGSLMAWIESLPYPVTIARGLRNSTDLLYEQTYIKWLNEFATKPINVVSIFGDPALEHISSSALNNVSKVEPEKLKKYIHE